MDAPVILIPVDPADRRLMRSMTQPGAPRWLRVAACICMERDRRLVLVKEGLRVVDDCPRCRSRFARIRALHKGARGDDPRCLLCCEACGNLVEDRSMPDLEETHGAGLRRFRSAF